LNLRGTGWSRHLQKPTHRSASGAFDPLGA
jgi:hypothetical protein